MTREVGVVRGRDVGEYRPRDRVDKQFDCSSRLPPTIKINRENKATRTSGTGPGKSLSRNFLLTKRDFDPGSCRTRQRNATDMRLETKEVD